MFGFDKDKKRQRREQLQQRAMEDEERVDSWGFVMSLQTLNDVEKTVEKNRRESLSELIEHDPQRAYRELALGSMRRRVLGGLKVPGVSIEEDGLQATTGVALSELMETGIIPNPHSQANIHAAVYLPGQTTPVYEFDTLPEDS